MSRLLEQQARYDEGYNLVSLPSGASVQATARALVEDPRIERVRQAPFGPARFLSSDTLPDHVPGHLIVKFRQPLVSSFPAGASRLELLLQDLGLEDIEPLLDPDGSALYAVADLSSERLERRAKFHDGLDQAGLFRYYILTFSPSFDMNGLADLIARHPEVEAVELNHVVRLPEAYPVQAEPVSSLQDEYFDDQWSLQNTQAGIDAPRAWEIARGDTVEGGIIIAVLDSGIDLGHPDLDQKILKPISFLPGESTVQDRIGHGTKVAGIAAAVTGNGVAMAGVCPGCRLMPIKIASDGFAITSANVARALLYAFENGAHVINMSFFVDDAVNNDLAQKIVDASIPLVAGVGNDGNNSRHYPASFKKVIAVGSTDNANRRWDQSDWGPHLDLLAPGVDIPTIGLGIPRTIGGGTSSATPHVSGIIGLLLGKRGDLQPEQIQNILEWTTDRDVCSNVTPPPAAPELYLGAGRVHAFRAMTAVAFDDVGYSDWFLKYVMYAREQGVIEGFGSGSARTFRPGDTTTRAEVLKMAYAAAAEWLNLSNPDPGFADVQASDWFYSIVSDAKSKGYIEGKPCGSATCFHPNEPVSRAEAVKIISVLFKVDPEDTGSVINVPSSSQLSFPDVAASDWFHPYVHWMANSELRSSRLPNGIEPPQRLIQGYPHGYFRPASLVNRAEMAKILVNTMLYFRTGPSPRDCDKSTLDASAVEALAEPASTSMGVLYEQMIDSSNLNAPTPLELPGGNEQTVTGPLTMIGDSQDADGDPLFYFWSADGGTLTTSDPVRFSRVTWTPPAVTSDRVFRIQVIRGDHRGLVGRSTFRFLVPGASDSPGSGTLTGPNGTQAGPVTVSATSSDPDGLARVSVTFISEGPELVLCGPDGPSVCTGASGTWSRAGIDPGAFGASSGTVTMRLFVEDATGEALLVDTHAFTFSPPNTGPTFKLTVRKEGDGSGTVSGGGLVCGPGCSTTSLNVPQGTSVTVTGSAAAGSVFLGFAGERCYGPDPCTLTMSSNTTLHAAFGLPDAFGIRFTAPANGDTGVATSAQIDITFNRDIAAGPNYSGLALRESGGTPVPFTPVIRSTDRRLVFIPASSLAAGRSYVVSIPAGAVSDTQGNPLASPHSFSFTTATAGAPKMYISAYPPYVVEGSQARASIWFETPASHDRTIALISTPPGELIHPSEVILDAGKTLVELQVDSRYNHGSTSPVTATLSAAVAEVGQQSVPIVVANDTSVTGASLKWLGGGVVSDTDQDGIFEAGEVAEIIFEVANFGSSTISNITLDFSITNTKDISILGGAPHACILGSLARGRNTSCTKRFRADDDLPSGDYFIEVRGASSANGFVDQARVQIVNNLLPDFILNAGSFPSAELSPGSIVKARYTARNNTDGFSEQLPLFEVTLEIEGTQHLLYRVHANARGYNWNQQSFELPIVVPPVPGAHTIRARINPPAEGRLVESDYSNNDATVLTLRVAGPNQPPALNPVPGPLAARVGRPLSFTAAATDPNNNPITYRLAAGAPSGASIGVSSGVFAWTPACSQGPASYAISIIADDGKGGTDTETFTVHVGLEADLGTAQIGSSQSAVPGQNVGITIVVTNAGPSCANGATLATLLSANMTDISWSCTASAGSSCAPGGTGNIGDSTLSLLSGGRATYVVTARIVDTASGLASSSETVTVPANATDPNGDNNSGSVTFTLRGLDFGDAPDAAQGPSWAFLTRLAQNGARHGIHPELRLGASIDAEPDGQASPLAIGDDTQGARDEDGVSLPAQLVPCESEVAQVTASAPGILNAWIDFNADGDWSDAGESVAANRALSEGINPVAIVVPCSAKPGATSFARFRFSSAGNPGISGLALDGEVEDHAVSIGRRSLDFYTVMPCRVLDTRSGGTTLISGETQTFQVTGLCDIPADAGAVSINITAIAPTANGNITLFPGDIPAPATSSINFKGGLNRANNAIVSLATDASGTLAARAFLAGGGEVDLIIDVSGYFQ